ncbi:glycosyltransferase family 39 protein [Candidatus Woesebacteria bacterium]|nr:glycosyltransferase family 39 protein [Candidatus Woesebacteria bacterium]
MKHFANLRARLKSLAVLQWSMIILLVCATFLRFWKLPESMLFLGDQGRDALIVSKIFTQSDLVFIGPTTSVGNMYLGPLYYYFMMPFLYLSYPSPVGPAYAIAALGVITVFFLYYWGRQLVGDRASVLAAFLCTFSATAVALSRFSWNPNPAPFVSLVLIFASYKALTKSTKYWILAGLCFAVLLQLHYITLLAGVATGVLWLYQLWTFVLAKKHKEIYATSKAAALAAVILLCSLLPLIFFDAKHGWLNLQSFQSMLTSRENFGQRTDPGAGTFSSIREAHGRGMHVLFEFLLGRQLLANRIINTVLLIGVILFLINYFLYKKQDNHYTGIFVLVTYLLVGILGLSAYKHTVFDHYILYLLPATFLLLGFILDTLLKKSYLQRLFVIFFLLAVFFWNASRYSFTPTSTDLKTLRETAESIFSRVAPGQKYAIALLTGTGDYYGMNYRYFLSTNPQKTPVDISEQSTATLLFIIDEEKNLLKPEQAPIYEVTAFSHPVVKERYEIPNGARITVLEH